MRLSAHRQSPPDMLVVNMQEVGGKHKENLPLMLRKGYVCASASGLCVSLRAAAEPCADAHEPQTSRMPVIPVRASYSCNYLPLATYCRRRSTTSRPVSESSIKKQALRYCSLASYPTALYLVMLSSTVLYYK